MARNRGTAALAPTVGPESAATARLRLPGGGPHDADTLDADFTPAAGTLDFGAVRVPVPADGAVALEPSSEGRMQAVHVTFAQGRLSVSALAAPRNDGLWPDLATEIDASLREGGARVRSFTGAWGRELHATTDGATSVFIGVDGPRWMLYGVATGPTRDAVALDARLRRMLRGTVVVRGKAPYPVRTVLPLVAPSEVDANNPDTPSQAPTMTLRTPAPSGAVTATGVADATQAIRPVDSGGPRAIDVGAKTSGVPHAPAAFHGAGVNGAAVNGAAAPTAGANGAVANATVANATVVTNRVNSSGTYPSGAYPSGVTPQGPAGGSYWPGQSPYGPSTNGAVPNPAATSGAYPRGVLHGPTYGSPPFGAATNGVTSPRTYPPGPALYSAAPATGAGPADHSTSGGYPTGSAAYGAPATGAGPAGAATSGGYPTKAITYGATDGAPQSGAATNGANPYGANPYGANPSGAATHGAATHGAATHGAATHGAATHGAATHGAATNGASPYGAPSSGGVPHGGALDPGAGSGGWSTVRPPGDRSDGYRTVADTSSRRAVPARWAHQSGSDLRSASPADQHAPVPSSSTAGLASPSSSELPWAPSDTAAAASRSSGFFESSTTPPVGSPSPATPVEPASHGRASWVDTDPIVADPDATSFESTQFRSTQFRSAQFQSTQFQSTQFQSTQFQSTQWDPLFDPLPGGLDPLPEPVPQWSDAAAAEPDRRRPAEPVGLDALPGAGRPLFDGTVSASGALRGVEPRLDDGPDVGTPLFDDAASASGGWGAYSAGEVAGEPGGRRRRESRGQDLPTEHGVAPRARRYRGEPVNHAAPSPAAPSTVAQASDAPTTDTTGQRPGRRRAPEASTTSVGRHEAATNRPATPARHRDDAHPRHADAGSRHAALPAPSQRVPPTQWAWPKEPAPADVEQEAQTGRRAAAGTAGPTYWSAAELLDTRGNGGPRRRGHTPRHGHPADPEAGRHQRP